MQHLTISTEPLTSSSLTNRVGGEKNFEEVQSSESELWQSPPNQLSLQDGLWQPDTMRISTSSLYIKIRVDLVKQTIGLLWLHLLSKQMWTQICFFVELLHPTGCGEDGKTQAEKKWGVWCVGRWKSVAHTEMTTQSGNVKSGGSSSPCNKLRELPPGLIISSQIMTAIFNLLFLVTPSFLEMNNNPWKTKTKPTAAFWCQCWKR